MSRRSSLISPLDPSRKSLSGDWLSVYDDHVAELSKLEVDNVVDRVRLIQAQSRSLTTFCSGSVYRGDWNQLGMCGLGTYIFPNGMIYEGYFKDNQFNGAGTIIFPNGDRYQSLWKNGEDTERNCKFTFADKLRFEKENWTYCTKIDRRFQEEIKNGIYLPVPASEDLPLGCYASPNYPFAYYDPKKHCILNREYDVLYIPTLDEEKWIMDNCRNNLPNDEFLLSNDSSFNSEFEKEQD